MPEIIISQLYSFSASNWWAAREVINLALENIRIK